MTVYITNSFSLNMLRKTEQTVTMSPVSPEVAADALEYNPVSAIPHANIAVRVSKELGANIRPGKATVSLGPGDKMIVAQPEGDYRDPVITYWLIQAQPKQSS